MQVLRTTAQMQAYADEQRRKGHRLVLVPTMGTLHAGHLALVNRARREGDHVTVSIFVNPTQFSPDEDLASYPCDFEADCDALGSTGKVDAVFAPEVDELYPDGAEAQAIWITSPELTKYLCGQYRPGHFRGVLTVVLKLFACCKPHVAVFGLKDAQQFYLLRRLSHDLALGIHIAGEPTVREADGLALSSRNAYLNSAERAQAVVLSRAVAQARELMEHGQQQSAPVVAKMTSIIAQAPLATLQYAEVVRTDTLVPVKAFSPGDEIMAAVAVYFDRTRLIDNAIVKIPLSQC